MPHDTAHDAKAGVTHVERKLPPEIPEDRLDPDAVKVVRRLRRAGFTGYLVGGCVRDLLLGMRPKDFDVATSAHPNQVKETFRNSRLIGRRFRLAHVFFRGGKIIEVSTFRANPLDELADLPQDLLIRHDNVFGNAEEDARRRDFTINALFYDVDEGRVVDHVGGKADLAERLVRTIGNPDVRMREDPVRILRAIRFAAKCGLRIEPDTLAAMNKHVAEIPRCAPPRVLEEVLKLLRSGASRRCLELMRDVGALRVLLPPVAEHLERRGPTEAERHLRALEALDAHVRMGEIPSDAVLLASRSRRPRKPTSWTRSCPSSPASWTKPATGIQPTRRSWKAPCASRSRTTTASSPPCRRPSRWPARSPSRGRCRRTRWRRRSCWPRWSGRPGCLAASPSGPGSSWRPSRCSRGSARGAASPRRRLRGRASSPRRWRSSSCRSRPPAAARTSCRSGRRSSPARISPSSSPTPITAALPDPPPHPLASPAAAAAAAAAAPTAPPPNPAPDPSYKRFTQRARSGKESARRLGLKNKNSARFPTSTRSA